jgi:hypothetical protein
MHCLQLILRKSAPSVFVDHFPRIPSFALHLLCPNILQPSGNTVAFRSLDCPDRKMASQDSPHRMSTTSDKADTLTRQIGPIIKCPAELLVSIPDSM